MIEEDENSTFALKSVKRNLTTNHRISLYYLKAFLDLERFEEFVSNFQQIGQ